MLVGHFSGPDGFSYITITSFFSPTHKRLPIKDIVSVWTSMNHNCKFLITRIPSPNQYRLEMEMDPRCILVVSFFWFLFFFSYFLFFTHRFQNLDLLEKVQKDVYTFLSFCHSSERSALRLVLQDVLTLQIVHSAIKWELISSIGGAALIQRSAVWKERAELELAGFITKQQRLDEDLIKGLDKKTRWNVEGNEMSLFFSCLHL